MYRKNHKRIGSPMVRPRSRDLLRVRSEDLNYDPIREHEEQEQLRRELEQQKRLEMLQDDNQNEANKELKQMETDHNRPRSLSKSSSHTRSASHPQNRSSSDSKSSCHIRSSSVPKRSSNGDNGNTKSSSPKSSKSKRLFSTGKTRSSVSTRDSFIRRALLGTLDVGFLKGIDDCDTQNAPSLSKEYEKGRDTEGLHKEGEITYEFDLSIQDHEKLMIGPEDHDSGKNSDSSESGEHDNSSTKHSQSFSDGEINADDSVIGYCPRELVIRPPIPLAITLSSCSLSGFSDDGCGSCTPTEVYSLWMYGSDQGPYDCKGRWTDDASETESWDEETADSCHSRMATPTPPPRRRGVEMTVKQDSNQSPSLSTSPKDLAGHTNESYQSDSSHQGRNSPQSALPEEQSRDIISNSRNESERVRCDSETEKSTPTYENQDLKAQTKSKKGLISQNKKGLPVAPPRAKSKLSIKPSVANEESCLSVTSCVGSSPTAVAAPTDVDAIGNQVPYHGGGPGGSLETPTATRRRNFSSSSLPVSFMAATIEEVEDGVEQGDPKQSQRSNSYAGTTNPSPRVPLRMLRREARVVSMNSPPRTRRVDASTSSSSLFRSFSDANSGVAQTSTQVTSAPGAQPRLREVDIVGESFESRYPWQRDVGIQCHLPILTPEETQAHHPHLHRVMSGPAMYTYFRSLSSNNSPTSSPPLPPTRQFTYNRSRSQSDLPPSHLSYHPLQHALSLDHTSTVPHPLHKGRSLSSSTATTNNNNSSSQFYYSHYYQQHHPQQHFQQNSIDLGCMESGGMGSPYTNRRASFRRRPRPSSMGAVENYRYQHELAKFRELHSSRADRKSDPQVALSPGGRRRMAMAFSDDPDSVSDLESILENPGDRPWDISRQTSLTSVDFENDILHYLNATGTPDDDPRFTEDYRARDDVLPSPRMSPRMWGMFEENGEGEDSDGSFHCSDDQSPRRRRLKVSGNLAYVNRN